MRMATLADLQESLADKSGFKQLADYKKFCSAYLGLLETERTARHQSTDSGISRSGNVL